MDNPSETKALIAVVDDDPRIRQLLHDELDDLGHDSVGFDNGFDLIDQLDTVSPAIVLMDLMMPQMDGIECLRRLRQKNYEGAVIIFTALSDNEKRLEADQEGASDYILKPDLFDNLETILTRHL